MGTMIHCYLPPANKVWGKVIFFTSLSHSLCPRGGCGVGFPACTTGDMTRGICIQGGLYPEGAKSEKNRQ